MSLNAVIFDLFGTLTVGYSTCEYMRMLHGMARALGMAPRRFRTGWMKTFPRRVTGRYSGLADNLRAIVQPLGIVPTNLELQHAAAVRRAAVTRALRPIPEAIDTLMRLKTAQLSLGLLSNCSLPVPDLWPKHPVAPLIDVAILSPEVHLKKPDPRIFLMISRCLGVEPEACIYVGDGGSQELTGAVQVGMSPIRMAVQQFQIERDRFVGQCITSLQDLPGVLGL